MHILLFFNVCYPQLWHLYILHVINLCLFSSFLYIDVGLYFKCDPIIIIQLSYAIGVAEPLSIFISSYSTGVKSDNELLKIVKANFDLRPGMIVKLVFQ